MSIRVVASSEDTKKLFSDNKPFDFRIKLNRTVQLDGYWVVALTEFSTAQRDDAGQHSELFIFSDICLDSFIGNDEQPLLRRIVFDNGKQNNVIYDNPYYIPVRLGGLQHIHIYIKDNKGQEASFLKERVTITLHFKKFPFVL